MKNRMFGFLDKQVFENPRHPFCRAFYCESLLFSFTFYSKCYVLKAREHMQFLFYLKSRDLTSVKRHFAKKQSADFAEILCEDGKSC